MSSNNPRSAGSDPSSAGPNPSRKGSVKRARELLEAGVRPTRASPTIPMPMPLSRPSPDPRNIAHQSQWPLPASGLQPRPLNPQHPGQHPGHPGQHPRFLVPRGPPPSRPPRPSEVPSQIPSPSIYSVRSGQESETSLNQPNYPTRPAQSFSQPKPHQQPPPQSSTNDGSVSPTSTTDMTPRISIATDDLFRQSTASGSSSVPDVPPIPLPEPPLPPAEPRQRTAGLAVPPSARRSGARRSSVSPIPEEYSDPRQTLGSLASSRAIPSSWGSGPAASEILGAYLDIESDDEHVPHKRQTDADAEADADAALVRSASLGKRGKPTMRTIMKSNPNSEVVSIPDVPSSNPQAEYGQPHAATGAAETLAVGAAVHQVLHAPSTGRRESTSTTSHESYVDPEKPRFAQPADEKIYSLAMEKELGVLPKAAPTMSDKRPGGKKPPKLDMSALRDAEARGSLSSLSDLIRRATRLASNLDHGRTASQGNLVADTAHKPAFGRRRNSGSLSDILASFPNPGLQTPETRGSWPVFFNRSGLRNVEPLGSNEDDPVAKKEPRKCCGIPRKWFILLCILLFIIVVLAILLPVFLIAVPKQNAKNSGSCSTTNPCQNGGVSVSSGSECSCVCANGYTGSQCTVAGDSSCITSEVDNGTISKKATMGSDLPDVFSYSEEKFGISLDTVTLMALFSMNNVSCKTENSLVTFDVETSSDTSKTRRAVELPVDLAAVESADAFPSSSVGSIEPTPALIARTLATSNGILYDGSSGISESSDSTKTTSSATTTTATATAVTSAATSITASKASATASSVPTAVVEFSRVAVLYILEKTGSVLSASWSGSQIETYLEDSYSDATHPRLELLGEFGLDFENKTITLRNGTIAS
ncbi:hypothetical protein N7462_001619 [Penicillium macrosclerotiorum]|uniref:uncharacterized protein n=1 Tax=Penicillium macrosclerotiorum TaxID=303699 RepID=UPI0025466175|nr:uncharacterized protein N7462_001619 [Penicillium macrosclerotiorum]KAJ5692196.1 hypothetical protein N7462_001619 [Penicillium macrosclerotiorum]